MMNEEGIYHSVFVAEPERTEKEMLAWCRAYRAFLHDSPDRPGWCQKKADDEWQKYVLGV